MHRVGYKDKICYPGGSRYNPYQFVFKQISPPTFKKISPPVFPLSLQIFPRLFSFLQTKSLVPQFKTLIDSLPKMMTKTFKGANVFMSRNLVPPEIFDSLHDALKLNGADIFPCCDPSRNGPNDYHVISSHDHVITI